MKQFSSFDDGYKLEDGYSDACQKHRSIQYLPGWFAKTLNGKKVEEALIKIPATEKDVHTS